MKSVASKKRSLIEFEYVARNVFKADRLQMIVVAKKYISGLEITAGQRTMSGLIVDLTGQTFLLPVMLTGQNSIVLKMK